MAIELRKKQSYVYEKVRVDGKVVSRYVGRLNSPEAQAFLERLRVRQEDRQQRIARRAAVRAAWSRINARQKDAMRQLDNVLGAVIAVHTPR